MVAIFAMPGQYQVVLQGAAWFQMVKDRPNNESVFETLSASVCGQRVCDSCEKIGELNDPGDPNGLLTTADLKWKISECLPVVLLTPPIPQDYCTDYVFNVSNFRSPPLTAPPRQA